MDDKLKATLLLGKAIDAMEDGVYPIASSFVTEALHYNPQFGEAYLIRALIVDAVRHNHPDPSIGEIAFNLSLDGALLANPDLDAAVEAIRSGKLTAKNHREWHALISAGINPEQSSLEGSTKVDQFKFTVIAEKAWNAATVTNKDQNSWRKDAFGAWMKISEYNKTTEFGWKAYENRFRPDTYHAFQWENITERTEDGEGFVKKVTSSDDTNIQYKSGCYIATVCYNSSDCPEVDTLRKYRDEVLHQNILGRAFVKLYYWLSPSISQVMKSFPFANNFIRVNLLNPLVTRVPKNKKVVN